MLGRNHTYITLHLRCRLPVEVMLGTVKWRISIQYYGKQSKHAEIIAESSDGKRGRFADGRATVIEAQLRLGISVPVGTIRYRLALALAATGRAEIGFGPDEEM